MQVHFIVSYYAFYFTHHASGLHTDTLHVWWWHPWMWHRIYSNVAEYLNIKMSYYSQNNSFIVIYHYLLYCLKLTISKKLYLNLNLISTLLVFVGKRNPTIFVSILYSVYFTALPHLNIKLQYNSQNNSFIVIHHYYFIV